MVGKFHKTDLLKSEFLIQQINEKLLNLRNKKTNMEAEIEFLKLQREMAKKTKKYVMENV